MRTGAHAGRDAQEQATRDGKVSSVYVGLEQGSNTDAGMKGAYTDPKSGLCRDDNHSKSGGDIQLAS